MFDSKQKPTVLLHSCCGPCSTACIERLLPDYHICILYYNPCINDQAEYELRKENQIKFINALNETLDDDKVEFIEGAYVPKGFEYMVVGYENEPEGGNRCTLCFIQRLTETSRVAKERDFDFFATTLTVSPHKNYKLISKLGNAIGRENNIQFLDVDFKKKDGFKRSTQLSKEYGLYRQDYCGCNFSKRD